MNIYICIHINVYRSHFDSSNSPASVKGRSGRVGTKLMLGGGHYSHAATLTWIEDTFLSALLRDSAEETTPRALKLESVIIKTTRDYGSRHSMGLQRYCCKSKIRGLQRNQYSLKCTML